ncbi:deoxycytidylate deaminase [Pseudoalteromonas sp. T1lg21]|uniref:deoxycytidylate deaminase n=1 Tax=Pseudoalteromonas sp. T1lg21 TaxID=2077095 RepID=UPI000CF60FA6|nr:deoxycytidylate deaminase [Pseudoalteromonas sp. T1lg21]
MNNSNEYLKSALEKLHSKNEDFIIIGLTGRTGSGCTSAARILSTDKAKLKHCLFSGPDAENNFQRKEKILNTFYRENWHPFTHLRVSSILTYLLLQKLSEEEIKNFLSAQDSIRAADINFFLSLQRQLKTEKDKLSKYEFFITFLDKLTMLIREQLDNETFVKLYQALGRNARRSGCVSKSDMKKGKFFTIAQNIKYIINELHKENKDKNQSTYITIDAIRNPLEASYFQERYSAFYLLAISCEEEVRKSRLIKKGFSDESINQIDKIEYSSLDLNDKKSFTDQDIQGCLQKADIYIDSNAKDGDSDTFQKLTNQLIKLVSLAQKPGLITPTPEERCMQVAYASKLNSGCLSRQVGAVVTMNNFSIKAVGWNDAPYGQVPCNLRSVDNLKNKVDLEAYSPFELEDTEFRNHMEKRHQKLIKINETGYNPSYCFKSEYNQIKEDKNQVHTRSLHAEENAFLQMSKDGGSGIEGGFLFTTASPCELCAKKAYQLGMKRIYYIDPYPGISHNHILTSGKKEMQPQMVLFNGAIGRAFHKLYTPIAAYKDELNAMIE